jgi:addiction module HigA family antidote
MAVTVIHPGEHLAEELKELGMSAAELARRLDVPTNRITAILNGQRAITGDTALRLAHFFSTSAEFWLNLQSLYELRVAQKKSGKSIRALPRLESAYRKSRDADTKTNREWEATIANGLDDEKW